MISVLADRDGADPSGNTDLAGCPAPDPAEMAKFLGQLGRDLGQRYAIQGYLGRGAFATVWKAYDRITEEMVAVKRFDARFQDFGSFYRELQALFRLRHQRIVRLINLSEGPSGARHLILEYCAGGNLRGAIGRARGLGLRCPPNRAQVLAIQLAEGLAVAHRQGLVHRDLKPENILFDFPDERPFGGQAHVKIVDFGLAKALQQVAMRPEEPAVLRPLSGSPTYMAPEQFDSSFTPASDVYALGVLLYELLHGRPPFVGAPEELAYQHLRVAPIIDTTLPEPWQRLLGDLLAKDPAKRCSLGFLIETLGRRETDSRRHPARQDSGQFARLRVPTFNLLANGCGTAGAEFIGVSASGLLRFDPETGGSLGQLDLPGLKTAASGPDGSLWLVQSGKVLRMRPTGETEMVLATPLPADAVAGCNLPGGRVRLAVLNGTDLSDYEPPGRQASWTRSVRSQGLSPQLARLGDGRIGVSEGPLRPQLMMVDANGEVVESVPLPGPCWSLGTWPHSDQMFALLLVDNVLRPCRIDPEARKVTLLEPATDLALLTCAPGGPHDLFGLCTNGAVICWRDSGEQEMLFRLGLPNTTFQAIATDGISFGVLCRAGGDWWIQFRTLGTAGAGEFV
jgi:serine/threonine protein kinase